MRKDVRTTFQLIKKWSHGGSSQSVAEANWVQNMFSAVCASSMYSHLCMGNAAYAYIIFIMWNSIFGLDIWYHFRFNISCGVAVMVRGHKKKSGNFWREGTGGGGQKNFLPPSPSRKKITWNFSWWPLTLTATPQLMLNRKWYQLSKPEMEFHMINIIHEALPMFAQTEKTTFSCKDDCKWTRHTWRWAYFTLRYFSFLKPLHGFMSLAEAYSCLQVCVFMISQNGAW